MMAGTRHPDPPMNHFKLLIGRRRVRIVPGRGNTAWRELERFWPSFMNSPG